MLCLRFLQSFLCYKITLVKCELDVSGLILDGASSKKKKNEVKPFGERSGTMDADLWCSSMGAIKQRICERMVGHTQSEPFEASASTTTCGQLTILAGLRGHSETSRVEGFAAVRGDVALLFAAVEPHCFGLGLRAGVRQHLLVAEEAKRSARFGAFQRPMSCRAESPGPDCWGPVRGAQMEPHAASQNEGVRDWCSCCCCVALLVAPLYPSHCHFQPGTTQVHDTVIRLGHGARG